MSDGEYDGGVSPNTPLEVHDDYDGYDSEMSPHQGLLLPYSTVGRRTKTGLVVKKFAAYYWPIVLGIAIELLFCLTMASWSDNNEKAGITLQTHWAIFDEANLKEWYWFVFSTCLAMRVLAVASWKCQFMHMKDTTFASVYMFFSTIQWVFYLAAYYWLYDNLTSLEWKPEVQVQYNRKHILAKNATTGRKVQDMTISRCLYHFDPLTCRNLTSQQVVCTMEFDDAFCSGWTWLGYSDQQQKCCVRNRYSLSPPDPMVPLTPFDMNTFFPVLQWLSVVAMGWFMRDTPMLPSSSHYSNFMNGVWLDVLDAVLFGDYVLNKKVWYPAYGIIAEPPAEAGYAGPEDKMPQRLVWRTWLIAFVTTVGSPVLYTLLRREHSHEKRGEMTVDDGVKQLVQRIRLLDKRHASDCLSEALKLQKEHYIKCSGYEDVHTVRVHDDVPAYRRKNSGRLGRAQLDPRSGGKLYRVSYDSDDEEEVVELSRLEPAMEEHTRPCGPKCCWGWLDFRGCHGNCFERWALVLDSCRSLFCLELPFFLWRWHFDCRDLGTNTISLLMLKNLVWGISDFLNILACGNENATCLSGRPIRWVTDHINGTILSFIWVGPGGFFRIAADTVIKTVQDRIDQRKREVTVHKAWLIVERDKVADMVDNEEGVEVYDREIMRLDGVLADLEKESGMTHL